MSSTAPRNRLVHRGTGRSCIVLRAETLSDQVPVSIVEDAYVLVVASERSSIHFTELQARAWLKAGAAYVCVWGPAAGSVEEAFDYAAFLPELGDPLPFTLMTTSHRGDGLEEALWFAFYNAAPPEDLLRTLSTVIVVVDSTELESVCVKWVQENTK